jgi:hypothetical protein
VALEVAVGADVSVEVGGFIRYGCGQNGGEEGDGEWW